MSHLSVVLSGSILTKVFQIYDLCTLIPRLPIYPTSNVWQVVPLCLSKKTGMRVYNSWSLIVENPEMFSEPNSVTRRQISHRETPNIFKIFSQKKATQRSSSKVSAEILYFGLSRSPYASLSLLPQNKIDWVDFCKEVLLKVIKIKRY